MKYIILLGDGMADYPLAELQGKTPLEAARTPHMDDLARRGTMGLVDTIPAGLKPGSDVANLAVLGYDPMLCYSGRGPLEAANMGVKLDPEDVAFRCNLVTLAGDNPVMEDFTAGHIGSSEAAVLIQALHEKLGTEGFEFYPGVGYRHLLVWRAGKADMATTPPHDITGQTALPHLPQGDGADVLLALMEKARNILMNHPLHAERLRQGKRPANAIWLWGQGKAPRMVKLTDRYALKGAVISAVDLLNGIGVYAGLSPIRVPGATGYTDTDYAAKARYALEALKDNDFVFVHVEAPDEMGHEGNLAGKIRAIEDFDDKVVGTVMKGLPSLGEVRLLILSDHPTPIAVRTHVSDPSPFVVYSTKAEENRGGGPAFGETAARATGRCYSPGHRLMEAFLGDWGRES